MNKYFPLNPDFWTAPEIRKLTAEERLFFLFLLTNPRTTSSGVYQISKKEMEHYTKFNQKKLTRLIEKFQKMKWIKYNPSTGELIIKNKKY